MTDSRREAYKVIVKTLKDNTFSDRLLSQTIKKMREDKEDTSLLYTLVKGTIKMQKNLDYICGLYTDKSKFEATDLKIKVILYMAIYQLIHCDSIPDHAAVNESVEMAKSLYGEKVASFVNAVLREYLRNPSFSYPTDPIQRIATEHSFPEDIISRWIDEFGEEATEYLCMYYNDVPRLHMRVNSLVTTRHKLKNYFHNRGVTLEESVLSKNILTSNQASDVLNNVSFDEGYFSIQDTSSALIVELLDPQPGENILDLFAGRGGKASYISELMKNTGELIAVDKIPNKIKEMKNLFEKLSLDNSQFIADDAFKFGPVAPAYDRVLLDVPCSGWGVFQKKSELRWQLNQDMPSLLKIQEKALNTGSGFVKPDGILVYSTCTINSEENERQIEKFLARNANFYLEDISGIINQNIIEKNYLKTIPYLHHIDGVFAARMRKKS